jgi:hypothetical protein
VFVFVRPEASMNRDTKLGTVRSVQRLEVFADGLLRALALGARRVEALADDRARILTAASFSRKIQRTKAKEVEPSLTETRHPRLRHS